MNCSVMAILPWDRRLACLDKQAACPTMVSHHLMRYEAAEVGGDGCVILADAHAASDVVHHPTSDHGVAAIERPQRREALINVRALIRTLRLQDNLPAANDLDVAAFAGMQRLAHEIAAGRLEPRGQEEWAVGIFLIE